MHSTPTHSRIMADGDLLARLDALKAPTKAPSPPAAPSEPHPSIRPSNTNDDIAARFRRLASGRSSSSLGRQPWETGASSQSKLEDVVASLPSERVQNVEDEQSLDELLKELGEDQSSWLNNASEEDRVSDLLKEAKAALPPQRDGDRDSTQEDGYKATAGRLDKEQIEIESEEQIRHQDEKDEKDADDYIAQIMADVELQKKQGTYMEDDSDSTGDQTEEGGSKSKPADITQAQARSAREPTPLDDLPSAPSTAPVLASISDSDLEDRFASLSLPSTPSNKPTSAKPPSTGAKAKSNLPIYTDEDIESWCVICNEDVTIRCLGCEGDLYCQECWDEGHTGPEAGYDERRHKAVVYNRGEGKEKRKRSLAAA